MGTPITSRIAKMPMIISKDSIAITYASSFLPLQMS